MSMEAWDDDGNICDPEDWGGMGGMPSNEPWEPSLPEDNPNWHDRDREDWLALQEEEEERFYEENTEKIKDLNKNVSSRKIGKVKDILIDEHEAIDLGLSVKWASCNVGAENPSDYGGYYAWGETKPKWDYSRENCKTYDKIMGSIAGDPEYDAATANWGSPWRLPTDKEIDELVSKCKWSWTTQGGHKGYKITGLNGNSIFLPAAGWRRGIWLNDTGEDDRYWSATPFEGVAYFAYYLSFGSGNFDGKLGYRFHGQPIRPVTE